MANMKGIYKRGLAVLFLSCLLLGTMMVQAVIQAQSYGRLINYVGIVRGATQRLVKLELQRKESNEIIQYIDGIIEELAGAEGPYNLPAPQDEQYQEDLQEMERMWSQVQDHIYAYRLGEESDAEVLALSEAFFEQANDTVFSAEEYSVRKNRTLLGVCVALLGVVAVIWLLIFWSASRKILFLENTNKELNELARKDPMTGAYQIEAFKEEAQKLLDAATGKKYALLYTDFTDFKYMNDVFGYTYGDSILKQYGEILGESLREGEIYGRVSADHFVILMHYEEKGEAAARQRKADQRIIKFMHNSYDKQSVPTCCGICCAEDAMETMLIDNLIDKANFARKTVKNGTNPNYVYYNESIRIRLREEKNVETRMQSALENHEFTVYYQPKVELKTGRIACAEALVRWKASDGAVISPDYFIPVFERKFLIGQLDQYVFEEVCRWLRSLLDQGREALPVSVNVSRLQFYDQDFVGRYVEIRDKYQIPPRLLEIEFTESMVFDKEELLIQIVKQLKKEGFSCSIDDFGKGYSSLSLLKSIPIDVLKIDRLFFVESEDKEKDAAVIEGIIDLVKRFHIQTVAEGIETWEQVEYLKHIGCDFVQGYVYHRPMPEAEYERLLEQQQ